MLNQIDLSRCDLNLFVLFEAVLHERHVGRAAARLSLSASAVSHGLGRLRRLLKDPLFLRTPKGVVPTERALALAEPIAAILMGARSVVAASEPFDAQSSRRRFRIAAPDALLAVLIPPLMATLRSTAPGIDIGIQQLLPVHPKPIGHPWQAALAQLDARATDIAILPVEQLPARFLARPLFSEQFVVAMRRGHRYQSAPGLKHFYQLQHLLVSQTGDAHGFVDDLLAVRGMQRRIVLTVPNFMLALAIIAESDLVAALPQSLVSMHAARLNLVTSKLPMSRKPDRICKVASRSAMNDAGVAWLFDQLRAPQGPEE